MICRFPRWCVTLGMGVFTLSGTATYGGNSLAEVSAEIDGLIEGSLQEYGVILSRIREEKVSLLSDINRIERENTDLRKDLNASRVLARIEKEQLESLRKDYGELESRVNYVHGVFNEFLVNFESRLHVGEDQRFKARLTELRLGLDASGISTEDTDALFLEAVEMGLERSRELVGGYRFEGRAINRDGNIQEGSIVVLGPAAYFSSRDGDANGLLTFHAGTLEPGLLPFTLQDGARIQEFVQSGKGELPLDASLGNAISLHEVNITLREQIKQGGPVGYSILALGGLALFFSLIIVIDLGRNRPIGTREVQVIANLARSDEMDKAVARAGSLPGSMGEMIRVGVDNLDAGAVFLEEVMLSVVVRTRPTLERFLPFLSITIVAAPLLGLLGTVVGMIKTFALITVFGTGDPKALSSGISEALVTTEMGLIVAIIVLLLHAVFVRLIKGRLSTMEQIAFDFVRFSTQKEPSRP